MYLMVTFRSLWHEYYLKNMWLLFYPYHHVFQFVITYKLLSIIL